MGDESIGANYVNYNWKYGGSKKWWLRFETENDIHAKMKKSVYTPFVWNWALIHAKWSLIICLIKLNHQSSFMVMFPSLN